MLFAVLSMSRREVHSQQRQLVRRFSSTRTMDLNKPFTKVMACNRGEIAIRICRAATELCASHYCNVLCYHV
jgi:hypothetical protein